MTTVEISQEIPKPILRTRQINAKIEQQALTAGLHPVLARVIAGRPIEETTPILAVLSPKLKDLISPYGLKDIQLAANRVAKAIINKECIGIETDHDCDGQTSHAVLYHNLVTRFGHPADKIRSYIGHRLLEGYGLSSAVAARILADDPKPALVITADNGSTDEPRIASLKEAGIDVIVTDHHEIPAEGVPNSAYACLNPTRTDCQYPDPYIAGCMVAWLLMAATRQALIDLQYLPISTPTLTDSLDFVAVGTVADCVSIARSVNNRAVVAYGLQLMDKGLRPCWRALKNQLKPGARFTSEDLGFKIGPMLNSDGRLDSAFGSVSLLLADTDIEAQAWVVTLQEHNETRKKIQKDIVQQGVQKALQQFSEKRYSLCLYLPEGHPGVHGIAASRLKDLFGRPTVFLAPKRCEVVGEQWVTGSARGIEGFHVRKALQSVADEHPLLLIAFGGHAGAGGVTLKLADVETFSLAFESATRLQLSKEALGPVIWTDGVLSAKDLNLDTLNTLAALEPFGREFEPPVFEIQGILKELRPVGDGTHAKIVLDLFGCMVRGIWFGVRQSADLPLPKLLGQKVRVACVLKENDFFERKTLEIQVVYMYKDE